jgi:hypothetical protein
MSRCMDACVCMTVSVRALERQTSLGHQNSAFIRSLRLLVVTVYVGACVCVRVRACEWGGGGGQATVQNHTAFHKRVFGRHQPGMIWCHLV